MADRNRSDIGKPIKNSLLSGAGLSFPFENFSGNSILVPVSQGTSSILPDDIPPEDSYPKTSLSNDSLPPLHDTTSLPSVISSSVKTSSTGYTGLFSAFFSGPSNSDVSHTETTNIEKKAELTSTGHSFSDNKSSFASKLQSSLEYSEVSLSAVQENRSIEQDDSFVFVEPVKRSSHLLASIELPAHLGENLSTPPAPPQQTTFQTHFNTVPSPESNTSSLISTPIPGIPHKPPETDPVSSSSFYFYPAQSSDGAIPRSAAPVVTPSYNIPLSSHDANREPHFINSSSPFNINSASPVGSVQSFFNPAAEVNIDKSNQNQFLNNSYSGISQSFQPLGSLSSSSSSVVPPPSGPLTVSYRLGSQKKPAYAALPGLTSSTVPSNKLLEEQTTELSPSSSFISEPSASNYFSPISTSQNIFNPVDVAVSASSTVLTSSQSTYPSSHTQSSSPPLASHFEFSKLDNKVVDHFNMPTTAEPTALNPVEVTSNLLPTRTPSPQVIPPSLNNLANLGHSGYIYRPAYHHWFYRKGEDNKGVWIPFSMNDSLNIEFAFNSADLGVDTVISTDGGRYDVHVVQRTKTSVFWKEPPQDVQRCSWFYKTSDSKFTPYDENTSFILEEEYKIAVTNDSWQRKVELANGDYVVIISPTKIIQYQKSEFLPDSWAADNDSLERHKIYDVKRGVQDFDIEEGEPTKVDHLVFIVHGIGSVCDLKLRSIEEAVDDFRQISLQLIHSHFQSSCDQGLVNRIEILPISWHGSLHGEDTGLDEKLKMITLKSIPRLRNFANDTLLDILFYTSPVYCQTIMQQVGNEINSLYNLFKSRNPNFCGGVSLGGHSLGSLILFDMLCHQKMPRSRSTSSEETTPRMSPVMATVGEGGNTLEPAKTVPHMKRRLSRNVSYIMGTAGTGQPFITYPQLQFQPTALFAMGSPIGMFVTVRGIDSLGVDFRLPTCPSFFNIFHPFDPVAYRIEALINPEVGQKRPVLIPHHKGRKRMHLELKETMARFGADLKHRLVDSIRSTWNTVYQFTMFGRADDCLEQEIDQVLENQINRQRAESITSTDENEEDNSVDAGRINQGRRVDYVLQEAPLESVNEYLSGLTSHLCYWNSEDTMLLMLKEIYSTMGVFPDSRNLLEQAMEKSPSSFAPRGWQNVPSSSSISSVGMNPTTPISDMPNLGPPPVAGFVRK